jgi:GH24 family phage-related lysozyme (muramidase)
VPFEAARKVFYLRSLPKYATTTRGAYPGVETLPADAQAGLLSLVYNRGAGKEGDRRREMAAIGPLVAARDLPGVAGQIRAMKRLWDPQVLPGLIDRREKEAQLVERARRQYAPGELARV